MSIEDALLCAVLEDPHNDAPRLVYADWLEEQGDERAEFIRVQCELAAGVEDGERETALRERERTLLAKHGQAWRAPLLPLMGQFTFERGFPARLRVGAATFLQQAEQIFRVAPVTHVKLTGARPIDGLARCPHLSRLTVLDMEFNRLSTGDAETLFASPHLAGLRELRLGENELGPSGVRALTHSSQLTRLRRLSLAGNRLGDAGIELLAEWPAAAALEHLNLAGNDLSVAGLATLLNSPHAPARLELILHTNRFG